MKYFALALSAIIISGCSLSQNPNIPVTALPQNSGISGNEQRLLNDRWWENFHDKELNLFVETALNQNSDLKVATLKVMQFREFLNIKKSEQLPSVDFVGSVSKTKSYMASFDQSFTFDQFELGAMATYEIDLWGKLKNTKMAAFEEMMRESYLRESIKQRIIADSVIAYFGLKTNTKLYQVAQEKYVNEKAFYAYMKNQYNAGLIRESDLLQEESSVQMYYDEMVKQKNILSAYKTAVAILLAKEPKDVYRSAFDISTGRYSAASLPVPANLPSDILHRRADIQAAEAKVKASAFLVSVAKSAFFPSISITGSGGYISSELSRLVSSDTSTYSAGANVLSPILDFGKIQADIKAAKIDQQMALLEYQETVRKAFGEVKDSLHAYASNKQRLRSQEKRHHAINQKKRILEDQYKEGFATHLELLEAKKEEFEVALSKEAIKFETLKSAVELYVSLGGGFKADMKNNHAAVSKM